MAIAKLNDLDMSYEDYRDRFPLFLVLGFINGLELLSYQHLNGIIITPGDCSLITENIGYKK